MHFIVLEGIDGTGKTTQIKHIEQYMKSNKIPYFLTKEPNESIFGQEIYNNLKNSKYTNITELLLFNAIRTEHLKNHIIPNIKAGKIVICDRFLMSTIVYQTILNKLSRDDVDFITNIVFKYIGDYKPTLTILLDSDPGTLISRHKHENKKDTINIQIKRKLRDTYLTESKLDSKVVIINADQQEENVAKDIYTVLDNYFEKQKKQFVMD